MFFYSENEQEAPVVLTNTIQDYGQQLESILHYDAANTSSYNGTGLTWYDLSGFNNHGTLKNGPVFNSVQKTFYFDGSDDYVENDVFLGTYPATIYTWFKAPVQNLNTQTRIHPIVIQGLYTDPNPFGLQITISRTSDSARDGKLMFSWGSVCEYSTARYDDNVWHNAVLVNNGATNSLYVDGSYVATAATGGRLERKPLEIGSDSNYSGRRYKGDISIVKIYNRALSAAEISTKFNEIRGRYGI